MAWTEKRGRKTIVIWREADGRRASKTFPTSLAARTFKAEVEMKLLTGSYTPASDRKQQLGAYLLEVVSGDLSLRRSTRDNQLSIVSKWIIPRIGHLEIGAVGPSDVRSFLSQLRDAGLGPASIQKNRALLSKAFNIAVRDGIRPDNPVTYVKAPKPARRKIRVLTPEEVEELSAAIEPRYRALVVLAAYSGLRTGELGALRLENLDLLRRRVSVVETVSGKGKALEVHDPKTEAGRRVVSIPEFVCHDMASHLILFPPLPDGRVFSTAGGSYIDSSTLFPAWKTALRRAGLPRETHFHDLRHTSVAFAIQMGAHPKEIQTRLGHAQISMTLDVYGHLFEGMDTLLAEKMNEAYGPDVIREVSYL